MFETGTHLWTEIELKKAKLSQQPVIVKYEDGEIADYGGPIEEITTIAVKNKRYVLHERRLPLLYPVRQLFRS